MNDVIFYIHFHDTIFLATYVKLLDRDEILIEPVLKMNLK